MLESTDQDYIAYFEAMEEEDSDELIFDDFSNGKRKRSSSEFDIYMEKMEEFMEKASFTYQAKENACLDLGTNQQLLYIELLKRDTTIQNLNKARFEEEEKGLKEIYKLERELGQMGKLLKGYRDSLEKIHQAFARYRARARCSKDRIEKMIIEFEMEWIASLEPHKIRLNAMDKRLLHVEKQFKIIKDLIAKRKTSEESSPTQEQ